MLTLMDSVIGENVIQFPSLTFRIDQVINSNDEVKFNGAMLLGHPPDHCRDMHGPIPVEDISGQMKRWVIKSGGKKIGDHVFLEKTMILLDTGKFLSLV
ncbi:hypothetical protein C0992_008623 [Termitomyces sp. T32_za158]|nr:hypothetical protein C0992_008623 [Termitomyces sp. T32_za158]